MHDLLRALAVRHWGGFFRSDELLVRLQPRSDVACELHRLHEQPQVPTVQRANRSNRSFTHGPVARSHHPCAEGVKHALPLYQVWEGMDS